MLLEPRTEVQPGHWPDTANAKAILSGAIAGGQFPGAALAWCRAGRPVEGLECGTLGWEEPFRTPVHKDCRYDLASLTKLYTLATVLALTAPSFQGMELPLRQLLPAFPAQITLAQLANHSSGLTPELQSLEGLPPEAWLDTIARSPLSNEPGARVRYSCTHYFVLARAAEVLGGAPLHVLMEELVLRPLGLTATALNVPQGHCCAPTEARPEGGFWHGTVHDEAARAWHRQTGGLCGNAGLFATARDVALFGRSWTGVGAMAWSFAPGDALSNLMQRHALEENKHQRVPGWQRNAAFYMGEGAPPGTWGHLGFTGPCLLVHPARGEVLATLCNRVHPTRRGPDRMATLRALSSWLFDAN